MRIASQILLNYVRKMKYSVTSYEVLGQRLRIIIRKLNTLFVQRSLMCVNLSGLAEFFNVVNV